MILVRFSKNHLSHVSGFRVASHSYVNISIPMHTYTLYRASGEDALNKGHLNCPIYPNDNTSLYNILYIPLTCLLDAVLMCLPLLLLLLKSLLIFGIVSLYWVLIMYSPLLF